MKEKFNKNIGVQIHVPSDNSLIYHIINKQKKYTHGCHVKFLLENIDKEKKS